MLDLVQGLFVMMYHPRSVLLLAVLCACLVLSQAKPYDQEEESFVKPESLLPEQVLPDQVLPNRVPPGQVLPAKDTLPHEAALREDVPNTAKWMSWTPSNLHKAKPKKEEKHAKAKVHTNPCKEVYCHFGRVCKANTEGRGECVCAGADYCRGHNKRVCGTDGIYYPSHCELHRMACVKKMHIGIDHSAKGCQRKPKKPVQLPMLYEQIIEPRVVEEKSKEPKLKDIKKEKKDDLIQPKEVVMVEPVDVCEKKEYLNLKNILLQYHCARIGETNCKDDSTRKQFVANIMFSYYDRSNDQKINKQELLDVEQRDHLRKLSQICRIIDMLHFDDEDKDGNISLNEFYKALGVRTVALEEHLKVFTTLVNSGNSIELKCDIQGSTELVWKRNGADLEGLTSTDIKVFNDGSLYIRDLGLHHMGNYTCEDKYNHNVVQTHVLQVQMPPKVHVNPSTQFHTTGSSVTLRCHADGVPEPKILWEMNEAPLTADPSGKHYKLYHNNATLEIKTATYTRDTGAYKCKAKNTAGTAQDISTLFIENSRVPKYSGTDEPYELFAVFHDKGYTVYEPNHCHIEHVVNANFDRFKIIPQYNGNTLPTMCDTNRPCSWGSSVNVRNKLLYVTQPKLNRVVVVDMSSRFNPVEVIPTDKVPVDIHYIEHLDQVWVLCWGSNDSTGSKTLEVIRQASEGNQHHTVHTQPVGNRFDLVQNYFLPPNNDLKHKFLYGYVVHNEQQGLHKLDLEAMNYVKTIDLKKYKCVPKSVAFLALGGQVLVHCTTPAGEPKKAFQVTLDYVTDSVLDYKEKTGVPYVAPDGRHVVQVNDEGDTITVYRVQDDGKLTHSFDEYTNLHISDVTFFPSEHGHGYDFYASSANKNDVLYISLTSGKVEMIQGVGQAMSPADWPWSTHNRAIVGGGVFGEYLMTPSKDSVVVIDGKRRLVQCEWQDIKHANVITWVEPVHV